MKRSVVQVALADQEDQQHQEDQEDQEDLAAAEAGAASVGVDPRVKAQTADVQTVRANECGDQLHGQICLLAPDSRVPIAPMWP